jgi:hypothetical protein
MFSEDLVKYLAFMKESSLESMRRNNEMGREDFYPVGQIAAIDQMLTYIRVKESQNV